MASVLQVIGAIEGVANAAVDITRSSPTSSASPVSSWPTSRTRRRCRTGCWCGRARTSPAGPRRARAAHGHRHAGDGDPARPRLDHRRGGRGHPRAGDVMILRARRRASSAGARRAVLGATDPAGGRVAHRPRAGGGRAGRDEEPVRGGRPRLQRPVLGDASLAAEVRCSRTASTTCRTGSSCGCCGPPGTTSTRPAARSAPARGSRRDRRPGPADGVAHRAAGGAHPDPAHRAGESDDVVVRVPVAAGSMADGARLADLQLGVDPGFHILAIRRGGRYLYRPRPGAAGADDELIASGPTRATRSWPSAAAGGSSRTRTPTRSVSSASDIPNGRGCGPR